MTYQNDSVYLDTHAMIWLENGELYKFGIESRALLSKRKLKISPMVKLELQYLYEIGRVFEDADTLIDKVHQKSNLSICQASWIDVVNVAKHLHFTRDPFDRLIVAHAMLQDSVLISKDGTLLEHYAKTVW